MKTKCPAILALGLMLATSAIGSGLTNSWVDGNGKWENGSNWSQAFAPSGTDQADIITNGPNNTVTIDATTSGDFPGTMTISNLLVNANQLSLVNAGTNVPLHILNFLMLTNGATMIVTNSAFETDGVSVGNAPSAEISDSSLKVQAGGSVQFNGFGAEFAVYPSDRATLTIEGGIMNLQSALSIGYRGTGTLWVANGSLVSDNLFIGLAGIGSATISNGSVVVGFQLALGNNAGSQGRLTILGGSVTDYNFMDIGNLIGAQPATVLLLGGALYVTNATGTAQLNLNDGTLVLSNGATLVADSLVTTSPAASFVNLGGTFLVTSRAQVEQGTMIVSGGTNQLGSTLTVATSAGSTGAVEVTAGELVATNSVNGGIIGIGNDGTTTNGFGVGTMTVSNGTVLGNQILLGSSVGGQGQLTVQTNGLVSLVGTGAVLVANDVTVDGGDVEIVNGQIFCGRSHPGAMTMSNGTANALITYVGYDSQGTLTMVAGQMTVSSLLDIGFEAGSTGSVWMSGGQLTATVLPTIIGDSGVGQITLSGGTMQAAAVVVGAGGGLGGTLTVSGGDLTANGGLIVSTGTVWVSGGQLLVPSSLVIGSNGIGQLIISNGLVVASNLVLTNGTNSRFALLGGAFDSGGTVVTNTQRFVVGNGSAPAVFTMVGGTHSFGNGVEIANNSTLSGCGTINADVTVDAGGRALANCGGTLTFAGIVTNNGVLRASGSSVLNFLGPVVNNGVIDVLNGGLDFTSPPTGNGTVLTTNCAPTITGIQKVGADIHISFTTCTNAPYAVDYETNLVNGSWMPLTNATATANIMIISDPGAALLPKRFYRTNLVVPP